MFLLDPRFFAFLGVAFLLVLSPGPTMAVVTETAVEYGRKAALWTVAGVGVANSTLALAAALGLSLLVAGYPWMLDAITIAGAMYLGYLGVRSIARAARPPAAGPRSGYPEGATAGAHPARASASASFTKGVATNLLNPSVTLFYMTLVPQFIAAGDPFFATFALLAGSHVLMAVMWHSAYAWFLGTISEHLARPPVRRAITFLTGLVLVGFALRLVNRGYGI